jgi:DNA anti-recombination protein RmuC
MSSSIKFIALIAVTALSSACTKGANEATGEAADTTVKNATGDAYLGDGPMEDRGENVDTLKKDAADAKADIKDIEADNVRTAAETKADSMENKADAIRDGAEKSADSMENKADAVRDTAEKKADTMEDAAKKSRP